MATAPECGDITLRGLIAAEKQRDSITLIGTGSTVDWKKRGDWIGTTYRLFHVEGDRAWLAKPTSNDQYAICQVEMGARPSVTVAVQPSERPRAKPTAGDSPLAHLAQKVEQKSDSEIALDRSVVEELIEKQGMLGALVRAKPDIENGRAVGLHLATVQAGSIIEKLGLKSGDKLRRVAGVDLDSLESGLSALARLRTLPRFSIEVVRDGRPKQIDYEVR